MPTPTDATTEIDPNELPEAQPGEVADDPNPPAEEAAAPAPEAEAEEPEAPARPKVGTSGDDKRRAIYERFRRERSDGRPVEEPPPDSAPPLQPEPPPEPLKTIAQPTPEAPAAGPSDSADPNKTWPRSRHKIKVRGQEIEIDTDQLVKLGQIALATESYENETERLKAARQRRDQAAAPRGTAHPQHPEDTDPASSADRRDERPDDPQHPEDPFEQLVDKIQFGGDRAEIAQSLRNVIASSTRQELIHDRMEAESSRSQALFDTFFKDEKNADVADDYSRQTMLGMAFEQFKDDLVKIGSLAPDAQVDPSRLAYAHRYLRVEAKDKVRSTQDIIDAVATKFRTWKTGQPPTAQPAPAPRPAAATVAVKRDDRKLRVPAQPQRHTALPPQAPAPLDIETSRARQIEKIRASRKR